MIAIAIASVMALSSCGKDENSEIVDPLAGKHVVEAVIHAEVTGAFTKAIAIEVEYKDFKGQTHKEIVNSNYDGKNAVFDATIETLVEDEEKEATFHFRSIKGDVENYKSEVSPWGIMCSVVAKLDGKEKKTFYFNEGETEPNKPILEKVEGMNRDKDYAYLHGVVYLDGRFADKNLIITVSKKEVTFTNWNI